MTKCEYCGGGRWTPDNGYHVYVNTADVCSAEWEARTGHAE